MGRNRGDKVKFDGQVGVVVEEYDNGQAYEVFLGSKADLDRLPTDYNWFDDTRFQTAHFKELRSAR